MVRTLDAEQSRTGSGRARGSTAPLPAFSTTNVRGPLDLREGALAAIRVTIGTATTSRRVWTEGTCPEGRQPTSPSPCVRPPRRATFPMNANPSGAARSGSASSHSSVVPDASPSPPPSCPTHTCGSPPRRARERHGPIGTLAAIRAVAGLSPRQRCPGTRLG